MKIEELEAKVKELQAEIEKLKNEEKEFPQKGCTYFRVDNVGEICPSSWDNDDIDNKRFALGNVFKTSEEAKFAVEKLKVIAELKKFAEPKDREWNNFNRHYYISWNYNQARIFMHSNGALKHNEIYFESEEKALEAIEAAGGERIKKYYLEVEDV